MKTITYSFTEEYNKLNPAQKKAVETIDGAVLVVAGPGTGKTQILAARIANILENTDAKPDNILCMTYTDAGALAMRNRLEKFIGSDAYRVNIHTFHSFCNRVIQENNEYFSKRDLEPIGDLQRIKLLKQLVDGLEDDNPLKRWRGNIYYDITDKGLQKLFSLMSQENLSVADFEKSIKWKLENLQEDPYYVYQRKHNDYKAGDLKPAKVQEIKDKFEKTLAAVKLKEVYDQLKQEIGVYDFDDMIQWVLQAFQENEDLLLNYQERFQYILVDEYQDTNGAQNAIFKLLISYWDNPNAFVVGDDDQSIFRFQGANLGNIVDFYQNVLGKAFTSPAELKDRVIVMKENYRSTQAILDLSASLIDLNSERLIKQISELGLDKDLKSSSIELQNSTVEPKLIRYHNPAHELLDIATQIEQLKAQDVDLREIAVIYAKHKQADDLIHYLNQKNIAVKTKRKVNILEEPFTNQLLEILEYIDGESRYAHSKEALLFKMFHFPYFECDTLQIARLGFELRDNRRKNPKVTWREVLANIQVKIDEKTISKMEHWGKIIEQWQKDRHQLSFQLLFQKIIDDLKILQYIVNSPNKLWLLQELKSLFDFIKQENQRNPKMSIADFLEIIKSMNDFKLSLDYMQNTYAENAVTCTTAHSSKGLEFKYVYIIGVHKDDWDKGNKEKGFKVPEAMLQKPSEESEFEERRRLFYVAATRAKEHLQISFCAFDENNKDLLKSQFISELQENSSIQLEERHLADDPVLEYNVAQLMLPKEIDRKVLEASFLKERLENYSMSVTHLNNFLDCPLKFYYTNFLQIPSAKNSYMAFGSAVHNTLEDFFKSMLENNGEFGSEEEFVDLGLRKLYGQEDSFSKEEYEQKIAYLKQILPQYYHNYVKGWHKDVELEKRIRALYKNIELNGALDKIEKKGNQINIIDYKTGMLDNAQKKIKAPGYAKNTARDSEDTKKLKAIGGDYWRQAVFYKILIDYNKDIGQQHWEYSSTEFDIVEPDPKTGEFERLKVVVSPEHEAIVKDQIEDSYKKIQNLEFEPCNKPKCEWCQLETEI